MELIRISIPSGLPWCADGGSMCARWRMAISVTNMVKASAVAKVLGGQKALGIRVSSQQDLITAVRRGLRTATVQAVMEELDASPARVLPALRIARRTMERRKAQGRLLPQESE